ncbi:MAG: hypothetical protein KGI25_08090 [Thaumarchaeota archaeon]|nr:hypothetical protein [Nitrososphaerota archaeon]
MDLPDSFLLKGKGRFTIDGRMYKDFVFNIVCNSEGHCTNSSIIIENSTIPVSSISYSTVGGQMILSIESGKLSCSVFDLGPAREGESVVFDCLRPYGSGISFDALLDGI